MCCVQINESGAVVDVVPQPADTSTCTLVLAAAAEVGASPFALSLDDAALISSSIALVWAVAWGARMMARQLWGG
jgi:hypothetical protein